MKSKSSARTVARQLTWLLAPLALAGCMTDRDRSRPDPLTGLPPRVPYEQRAVSAIYAPADRTASGALASSGSRLSDSPSSLGIRDNKPTDGDKPAAASVTWTGAESHSATPAAGAAKLGGPAATSTSPGGPAPTVRVRTFEEGQQFLAAHNVKWQDLQFVGEAGWKFSCTVPGNGNSTTNRTYEASDRWGLLAMQKVIDQIVRDQGH